jgi:hypothetical protein
MTAVIRSARRTKAPAFAWVNALLERRPARLVSVALANKAARIACARSANFHQGQRSCAPRKQAGHMSALDPLAETSKKPLAPQGPSTHGHYSFTVPL